MVRSAKHRIAVLAAIAWIAWKMAYLAQYLALPFLLGPVFDAAVYLRQAEAIAEGHFGDPTLLAFSPLYGYMLAAVSGSALVVVLIQLLLGLLCVALVYTIAERFAPNAGAPGAALYAGYGVFLFFETKVYSETLGLTLVLGALAFYVSRRFEEGATAAVVRVAFVSGLLLGLAVLARASLLFAAPLFVVAALVPRLPRAEPVRTRVVRSAALAAGLGLILLGNGAWNFANTGFFVPVIFVSRTVAATTSGPWTGTLPRVDPDRMPSAWDVVHQADDRLHGRAHPSAPGWGIDLAGYARNAPRKLVETFSDTEHTHDYGYYGERSEVAALHMTPITFGALALLAVAGAGLLVRRAGWRRLAPLAPLFFGTIVTTTLYHPSTRYRLPLVLVLVVLAAVAVGAALRAHIRWRVGVAALLLAFAVRGFTHQLENPAWWELRVAEAAQAAGDADEVNRRVARARQLAPDDVELEQRIRGLTGHRPGT